MKPDDLPRTKKRKPAPASKTGAHAESEPTDWHALYLQAQCAREQAEAQAQNLSRVLMGLGHGLIALNHDLRYCYVNPMTLQLMGRTEEEVLGRHLYDLHPDIKGTPYTVGLETALRERRQVELDIYYPNDRRWQRTLINPTETGLTIHYRDVTDLKVSEILQQQLASIVDSSDDAIISKTLDGIITTWNPAAERMLGYAAEEVIGKPKTILFPPDRLDEEEVILKRLREGISTDRFETVRIRKDGVPLHVSLTISPIKDANGQITGASTIARDITEEKQQQRELAALAVRLRRAMQETHHRVKNNLQVIAALLDMLLFDYDEVLPIHEVKRLAQQVMTLAGIHDILTREVASVEEAETLLSAKEVLSRLLTMLEETARGYRLEYDIQDVKLSVRQVTSLALAVNELVMNGILHGRKLVRVSFYVEERAVRLIVEDDGPGLPEPFDPFTAANTGLSLVANLVQHELGGRLAFENRAEGGARVRLTVPLPLPSAAP
jgi:PAS domain S-box-containing protein